MQIGVNVQICDSWVQTSLHNTDLNEEKKKSEGEMAKGIWENLFYSLLEKCKFESTLKEHYPLSWKRKKLNWINFTFIVKVLIQVTVS